MFVSCYVGRTARNNQKIHFLYRTCSYFKPVPLRHTKKNKRFWCLEPFSKEEQSIKKRAFLEEGTKNKGKAMTPELKQELVEFFEKDGNSQIFLGKKGNRSVHGKDGEKILDYSPRIPFSFFNARLVFTMWFEKFFHYPFCGGEGGLGQNMNMFYTSGSFVYVLLAVLPTRHKANINLCHSHLMLR